MFEKILIANRGEIAFRIIRICMRMGVAAVAVYSDADCCALRTPTADESVRTGESAPRLSYVSIDRIVQTTLRAGAKAIRHGYGFLSENLNYAGLANSRTSCSSVRARRRSGQWQ